MPHERSGENTDERGSNEGLLGRRACLKGIGGVAASVGAVGALTGRAAAATTHRGVEFERVINVVDDLGCDPNGNEPVQKKIMDAKQEGTLFVLPEGEYLLTERLLLMYKDAVGIVGEGAARFVVPERFNDHAVIIDRGERLVFENVDLDLRADGATPGYKFGAHDRAEVHNVELVGQGIHSDSDPRGEGWGNPVVNPALHLVARKKSAEVLVENFVARNKGLMGAYNYGKGRTGIWIGEPNKGTVTVRNCHISGFPNNGMYTSRTYGVVQVEGGVFRNNDISQVRLGSEGSYVKGAFIEVDPAKSDSPNIEDMLNGRGVRIESGPVKTGGVTVRDCDITIAEGASSEGGVIAAPAGGEFDVVDTRIRVDPSRACGVNAKRPATDHYAPPWPRRVRLKNVSVTGANGGRPSVTINNRYNSVIESCCIEQPNSWSGIKLIDSGRTVVENSTVNVDGQAFTLQGSSIDGSNNKRNGSCPLPASKAESTANLDAETEAPEPESEPTKRITFIGSPGGADYYLEVSGEVLPTDQSEEGEITSPTTAEGTVGANWADAFEYTGKIERIRMEGMATFIYDDDSSTLAFKGNTTDEPLPYEATVGGKLWRTHSTGDPGPQEAGDGIRVEGELDRPQEVYGTTGGLRSVEMYDFFSLTVEEGEN